MSGHEFLKHEKTISKSNQTFIPKPHMKRKIPINFLRLLPVLTEARSWPSHITLHGGGRKDRQFCWERDEENWEYLWSQGFFQADLIYEPKAALLPWQWEEDAVSFYFTFWLVEALFNMCVLSL